MSEKIFLKLNFDSIVAEMRGVFGSMGGGRMRVCVSVWSHRPTRQISRFYLISVGFEIVAATVFSSAKAQFWMISDAILIPKIYARLQEIAFNFSKFFGGDPQTTCRRSRLRRSVRGFAPLPGPLYKIPGSAPNINETYAISLCSLVWGRSSRPMPNEQNAPCPQTVNVNGRSNFARSFSSFFRRPKASFTTYNTA